MVDSISTECCVGLRTTVLTDMFSPKGILKLLSEQFEMVAGIRTYCVTIRQTGHIFCRLLDAIERDEPN